MIRPAATMPVRSAPATLLLGASATRSATGWLLGWALPGARRCDVPRIVPGGAASGAPHPGPRGEWALEGPEDRMSRAEHDAPIAASRGFDPEEEMP